MCLLGYFYVQGIVYMKEIFLKKEQFLSLTQNIKKKGYTATNAKWVSAY